MKGIGDRGAQHGGEYRPVVFNPSQYHAAFLDAHVSSLGRVGAAGVRARVSCLSPNRAIGVQTDPIGSQIVGPRPTVGQAAIGAYVERGKPTTE